MKLSTSSSINGGDSSPRIVYKSTQQLPVTEIVAVVVVILAVATHLVNLFEHSAQGTESLQDDLRMSGWFVGFGNLNAVVAAIVYPIRALYRFMWSVWYLMVILLVMFGARAIFFSSSPMDEEDEKSPKEAPNLKLHKGDQIQATIRDVRHEFELLKRLGKGAYGEVWMAVKKDTGIIYAIKILDKSFIAKTDVINRVVEENNIMQSIHHPFVVRLAYAFQDSTKLFLVEDYVGGGDMFSLLEKQEGYRLPEDAVRFYVAEVMLALAYLHSKEVVYRDLKPENILLGVDGHVVLTDFGTATRKRKEGERLVSIVGTPDYMAPELVSREGHGQEVDWWSLGILTYQMLYGRTPFASFDYTRIFFQIRNCSVEFPETPAVSQQAKDLIVALLKKDPAKRLGRNGPQEIQNHPFFRGLQFDKLIAKQIDPPKVRNDKVLQNKPPTEEVGRGSTGKASSDSDEKFMAFNSFEADVHPHHAALTDFRSSGHSETELSSTTDTKALKQRIKLLFQYRAWCILDRQKWEEILAPNCVLEMPFTSIIRATIIRQSGAVPTHSDSEVINGIDGMVEAVRRERKRMGQYIHLPKRIEIDEDDIILKDNKTMFMWMIHAQHMLEPREVSTGGMAKVAFDPETGKITEAVWKWDVLTYMEQLGGFEVIEELIKQRQQLEVVRRPPSPKLASNAVAGSSSSALGESRIKMMVLLLMNELLSTKELSNEELVSDEIREITDIENFELYDYNAGGVFKGTKGIQRYVKRLRKAIGGFSIHYTKVEAENNNVRVDWEASGSYHGQLDVKSRDAKFNGVAVFSLNDAGKISQVTNNWDALSFLRQLNS